MADDTQDKARRELDKQLAALSERPTDHQEGADHARGALPGLFRAARAVPLDARAAVVRQLAARLPDLPLVAPTLELAGDDPALAAALGEALRELGGGADAWCALRQAAALAPVVDGGARERARAGLAGDAESRSTDGVPPREVGERSRTTHHTDGPPERLVALLAGMSADAPWDPTDTALEVGVGPLCDALREVVRLRLQAPARRRDRTSAAFARGALRALVRMVPDEAPLHTTLAQVVAAEARRAGKDEPLLALDALDGLAAAPPFQRLRLLGPLLRAVERPKVRTRLEAALEAAAQEVQVGPDELAELQARTGGLELEADGGVQRARARVALDDGDAFLWVGPRGEVHREPAGPLAGADARVVEAATRELEAARAELARRLEAALVSGRDWAPAVWRAIFQAEHPLWSELAARLVWELRAGAERRPFMVGPDGPEDLFGERVDVDVAGARVGLAHPVLLPEDELDLWRERALELAAAGERRLVAPFPQLHRPVAAAAPDALQRFVGREAYKQSLGDMAREGGWKGFPLVGSSPWELERAFTGPGRRCRARLVVEDVPVVVKKVVGAPRRPKEEDDDGPRPRRRQPKRPPPPEAAPRVRLASIELVVEAGGDVDQDARVPLAEVVRELEVLTDPLASVDELFLRTWQHRKWKDEKEAWREVVLRYRLGSPALVAVRKALLAALARREGMSLRLEDRFAISGVHVIELGTGLVHQGAAKDHLPLWKVEEELGAEAEQVPDALPFEVAADPDTVEVVTRVLALARRASPPPG